MHLAINFQYSDIFDDIEPTFESLLNGIPSHVIISSIAYINDKLYLKKNDPLVQLEILKFLLRRQPFELARKVINKIIETERFNSKAIIFSTTINNEFIHRELINFRESLISTDTDPIQELNIFKAYLLLVTEKSRVYSNSQTKDSKDAIDYFYKNTWPILIDQYPNEEFIDGINGMVKSIVLLNYLQYHSNYSSIIKIFLDDMGKDSSWNYVLDLFSIVSLKYNDMGMFSLDHNNFGFEKMIRSFVIDPVEYKKKFYNKKFNFAGIKDKPLFNFKGSQYIILDWNFFVTKLHEGLKYDIYKLMNSNYPNVFNTFPDFLNYIGSEITEKFLFRKLIENVFDKKYMKVIFDDNQDQSSPDCYIRDGNTIYIFEIKDSLMSSNLIDSNDYKTIINEINIKYNNPKKGTGQLMKHINNLMQKPLDGDSYETINLKQRNIIIYPILIYTDRMFGIPGISHFLSESFNKEIKESDNFKKFKKINRLTFISLDFMISNFFYLKSNHVLFKNFIDTNNNIIHTREKKFNKENTLKNLFKIMENFETVVNTKYSPNKKHPKFVESIVKGLNLTEGLPKS